MAKRRSVKKTLKDQMVRVGAEFLGEASSGKASKLLIGMDEVWVPHSCLKTKRDDEGEPIHFISKSFANDQLGLRTGMFKNAPSDNPNRYKVAKTLDEFEGDEEESEDDEAETPRSRRNRRNRRTQYDD